MDEMAGRNRRPLNNELQEIDVDKKLKTKWVAALRSGKYKQGCGQLKTVSVKPDGSKKELFCCLGVLKDIQPDIRARNHGFYLSCYRSGLDRDTQKTLGAFNDGGEDGGQWSFRRIATWIEKNL
jgi:hypothetical protein